MMGNKNYKTSLINIQYTPDFEALPSHEANESKKRQNSNLNFTSHYGYNWVKWKGTLPYHPKKALDKM